MFTSPFVHFVNWTKSFLLATKRIRIKFRCRSNMHCLYFKLTNEILQWLLHEHYTEQAGAELCQAQGKIKLANFGCFCLICLVLLFLFGRFGLIDLVWFVLFNVIFVFEVVFIFEVAFIFEVIFISKVIFIFFSPKFSFDPKYI